MINKLMNLFYNINDLNHVFSLPIAEKLYVQNFTCRIVDELMGRVSATCLN